MDQITGFIEWLNWFFRGVAGLRGRDHKVEKAETDGYN
jgi:hypothetical protein